MVRKSIILASLAGALAFSQFVFAQDPPPQPSLADIARQARKDKENSTAKPKKVFTDDTLPKSVTGSGALAGLAVAGSGSASSGGGDPLDEAMAQFTKAEADFNQLDALDQAALAKVALAENCHVQFPSRATWEVKLFSAKGAYVTHMRFIVGEMKRFTTEAQGWKGPDGKLDPNDPRVQGLKRKTESTMQDAVQTQAAFDQVVAEGVALAGAAKH
jgi:hypothetical protein